MLTQDFFLYVDPTEYSKDAEGMFQACYDEVVAEAKDTGDYPMYGEALLLQSAKWKQDDLIQYLQRVMGEHPIRAFVNTAVVGGSPPPPVY